MRHTLPAVGVSGGATVSAIAGAAASAIAPSAASAASARRSDAWGRIGVFLLERGERGGPALGPSAVASHATKRAQPAQGGSSHYECVNAPTRPGPRSDRGGYGLVGNGPPARLRVPRRRGHRAQPVRAAGPARVAVGRRRGWAAPAAGRRARARGDVHD